MSYDGHPSIYKCRICHEITNDPVLHMDDAHPEKFEGKPLGMLYEYFTMTRLGRSVRSRPKPVEAEDQTDIFEQIEATAP